MEKYPGNKKSVLIDSSIWVSLLVNEEPTHHKATLIFNKYLNQKFRILMPKPVLAEVINVVYRKQKDRTKVEMFVRKVFEDSQIEVVDLPPKILAKTLIGLIERISITTFDLYILACCHVFQSRKFESFDQKQFRCYHRIRSF